MPKTSTIVRMIKPIAKLGGGAMPGTSARILEWLFRKPQRYAMPEREKKWLHGASEAQIRMSGGQVQPAYIWGEGPTVLLVHGWSGRASQMAVFAEPLVKAGFRVAAFDAPGHGPHGKGLSSLPQIAESLLEAAEALGPVKAVLSHSLGGLAATLALTRGLRVERAVFISPPDTPLDYLYKASDLLGFGEKVAHLAQDSIEQRLGLSFDQFQGSNLAPGLDLPLLLIHDEDDREVPFGEGRRLAQAWPGAEMMTTRGLGHRRILRDPLVIEAAVDYLAQATKENPEKADRRKEERNAASALGANREYRLAGRHLMDSW